MSFVITPNPLCEGLQFRDTTGVYSATNDPLYNMLSTNGTGYNGLGPANIQLSDVATANLAYVLGDGITVAAVFSGTQWLPGVTPHAYLRIDTIAASNDIDVSIDGNAIMATLTNISTDIDVACAAIVTAINAYVSLGTQWQAEYLGSGIIHVWTYSVSGDAGNGLTVTLTTTGITDSSDATTTGSGNGNIMTYALPALVDGMYTFQLDLYDSAQVLLGSFQYEYLHTCNAEKCLAEAIFRKAKSDCGCGGGCSGCAGAEKLAWLHAKLWAVKKQHENGVYACVHEVVTKLLSECQGLCKDC